MTMTCIRQEALHNQKGSSDKLYIMHVYRIDDATGTTYSAVFYNGRRGSSLVRRPNYHGPSQAAANADFDKQERTKRREGYDDYIIPASGIPGLPAGIPAFGGPATASPTPAAAPAAKPAPAAPVSIGPALMRPEDIDAVRLEELLKDPDWVAQKKYDGERCPVSIRRTGMLATNLNGIARGLTSGAEALLKQPLAQPDFGGERETLVDGEIMGDAYVIYDVLTLRNNDVRSLPYYERFGSLEALFGSYPGLLAETAWTEAEKRAMLARAIAEDWEGIILRNVNEAYVAGRTIVILRYKLWATATCRTLAVNTKRSIQLAMLDDDGVEQYVGNVTVPPNQDVPKPGTFVEVRYLYATEGGMLYQPTLLRERDDKDKADLRSALRPCPPEKRSAPLVGTPDFSGNLAKAA
ncbi:hypothetical protein AB4Y45_35065 [Paraburkholderia sp. EG287A]|uniref:hypothetical protein n=1 Tax=Paraburkholderia sp. EG287A TaxID=3237012 RepID=UPI0034D2E248